MRLYSSAFREGYRDYIKGFTLENDKSLDYRDGWYAARIQFMNNVPYDEHIAGELLW